MKKLFKVLASLVAFVAAMTAVATFLGEKARESKYIVMDNDGNQLF